MKIQLPLFLFVLSFGALLALPAAAQAPPRPHKGLRAKLLKRFDENHNGRLDPAELKKARAARRARRRDGAGRRDDHRRRGRHRRRDGAKRPTRKALIKRFDANHNGHLDPDELEKARAAIKIWRQRHGRRGRARRRGRRTDRPAPPVARPPTRKRPESPKTPERKVHQA